MVLELAALFLPQGGKSNIELYIAVQTTKADSSYTQDFYWGWNIQGPGIKLS